MFYALLFNFVNYVFSLLRMFCYGYSVSSCAVLLPPGVKTIAVNKYVISYHIIAFHEHESEAK